MKSISELLKQGEKILVDASVDNAKNEALWILESLGVSRRDLIINASSCPDGDVACAFLTAAAKRAEGVPLQYIIGEWDFYSYTFKVGEGVLIPRPESEMLVDCACEFLKDRKDAVVYDLCAGSGCIGLSIAKQNPDCKVYLVEKSEKAAEYLNKNISLLEVENAQLIIGDIFNPELFDLPCADVLVSNPPYIASSTVTTLQKEVLHEPIMALDGGADGLDFYRAILQGWLSRVKRGGFIAFECGEEQTSAIAKLFPDFCIEVKEHIDIYGQPRMVTAKMKG